MIEVKVPKEIRKYKEKILGGFSLRQLFALIVTGAIVIPIYIYLKEYLGDDMTGYIIMITAIPMLLIGFYEKDGLTFEKCIGYFLRFNFLENQKRKYIVENIFIEEEM